MDSFSNRILILILVFIHVVCQTSPEKMKSAVNFSDNTYSKVLVDIVYVRRDVGSFDKKKEDVRNLALVLSHVATRTFGLLKCEGVIIGEETRKEIGSSRSIFEIPSDVINPRSYSRQTPQLAPSTKN